MTSTLLIGVFVLVCGLLLLIGNLYELIAYLRKGNKMSIWTKFRNWWGSETKFETWMKTNHPSLEYEYNTRYLEWTRNTNRQIWRKRMMAITSIVIIVSMGFFDSYIIGMLTGAALFGFIAFSVNYCTVNRLEDERKEPELEE